MTDTQDKAKSAEERFDAACQAHGIATPEDTRKLAADAGGNETLFNIFKEAGLTKEDFAILNSGIHRNVPPWHVGSLGAVVGGGIAAAALPVLQLVKKGGTSWRAFAEAAPKTVAIGAVLGALTGVAATKMTNRHNEHLNQAADAFFDKQEARWADREAEKKAAMLLAASPQK